MCSVASQLVLVFYLCILHLLVVIGWWLGSTVLCWVNSRIHHLCVPFWSLELDVKAIPNYIKVVLEHKAVVLLLNTTPTHDPVYATFYLCCWFGWL